MAEITVTLTHGLRVGETVHTEAVLREASVADFLAATEDGERVVRGQGGETEIVASPTLVAVHLLRRIIVRVGDHPGPLSLGELKRLHVADLHALHQASEQLQGAALKTLGKPSPAAVRTPS
jgi:phage FluMu protein gp41